MDSNNIVEQDGGAIKRRPTDIESAARTFFSRDIASMPLKISADEA